MDTQKQTRARLQRASERAARAESSLRDEIHAASYNGMSLRDIAQIVGWSHETIRRILGATERSR